eukprot:Skav220445  [mRNA]  locus=scaffold254:37637:46699:- [translate_table: standard]
MPERVTAMSFSAEAVPEVDEDCLDDEGPWNSAPPVWRWRRGTGGTGARRRQTVFQRVSDDGEADAIAIGCGGPRSWLVQVHAYIDKQSREYENAFFDLDKDGSGTIEAGTWVCY